MLKSLKGLEYAENLEWLSLVNQKEDSLEPLKNCEKLKHLDIRNNDNVKDLSPLSNLINLEELDMRSIKSNDIKALSHCKKLRRLCAFSCDIKDLSPLKNLTDLEYLELQYNKFDNINDLSNLTKLEYLDISRIGIKHESPTGEKIPTINDIEPLNKLINLEFLGISSHDIKDITPIENMKKLKHLNATNNLIEDWTPAHKLNLKSSQVFSQGNPVIFESGGFNENGEKFNLKEVINPPTIKAKNKEDSILKLPKKISIKLKKYDDSKPIYSEGIYKRSTLRYIVKDETGNIIKEALSFNANTINSKETGYYNSISKDGYVDFISNGIPKEMNLSLNTKGYELIGEYKFKESTCTEGYHIDWVEKNGKRIKIDPLKPKNGTTFNIPEDKKDVFVIVVKKSSNTDTENPPVEYEEGFAKKDRINFIIKDIYGNIVTKDGLRFTSNEIDGSESKKDSLSKGGYVEIGVQNIDGDFEITLSDDEYELVGYHSYSEKYEYKSGNIINKIKYGENRYNNKVFTLSKFKSDGKAEIPQEAVTLILKKKGESIDEKDVINTNSTNSNFITPIIEKLPETNNDDNNLNDNKEITIEVNVKWTLNTHKSKQNELVFDGKLELPENVNNFDELSAKAIVMIPEDPTSNSSVHNSKSKKTIDEKKNKKIVISAGKNREQTSIELSRKYYANAKTVILVNGYNYADALVSSSLSSSLNAPILLINNKSISTDVKNEITRLNASKIIVIGGENSLPTKLLNSIKIADVERIAGKDRYETANKVYDKLKEVSKPNKTIIASGEIFADALSAGTISGSDSTPILLAKSNDLTKETIKRIRDPKINQVIVVGGENSVSNKVVSILGKKSKRLSGKDRYETSKIVAEYIYPSSKNIIMTSGEKFADAISIGGIVKLAKAPILLTTKHSLPDSLKEYLIDIENIEIIGGDNTLDKSQLKY